MKELTTLELAKILQSNDISSFFSSTNAEQSLESATIHLLRLLAAVKERKILNSPIKDPDEAFILSLLTTTLEKISSRRPSCSTLALPAQIRSLLLSQRPFTHSPLAFAFDRPDDPTRRFAPILLETAELWISHIKATYSRLSHSPRSFPDEKSFWSHLRSEIDAVANFSATEDYRFMVESLRKNGHLSAMFTLTTLVTDRRIHRLCDTFHGVYALFDFSRITGLCHSDSEIQQALSQSSSQRPVPVSFISAVFVILRTLRKLRSMPRIVRKSLASNLNALRATILREGVLHLHPTFYELCAEFTALALHFNRQNERDSADSRISIESIADLSAYTAGLRETYLASELVAFASGEDRASLMRLISSYERRIQMEMADEVIVVNKDDIRDAPPPSLEETRRPLLSHEAVNRTISSIAHAFITESEVHVRMRLRSHKALFELKPFRVLVSAYVESVVDGLFKDVNTVVSRADSLCTIGVIEAVVGQSELRAVLETKGENIRRMKEEHERYMKGLECDMLDQLIVEDYVSGAESDVCSEAGSEACNEIKTLTKTPTKTQIRLNKRIIEIVELEETLIQLHELLLVEGPSEISTVENKLLSDLQWIKPRLSALEKLIRTYKGASEWGRLGQDEDVAEFLDGLRDLKWKYYSEDQQAQAQLLQEKTEKRIQGLSKVLDELRSEVIPGLIREQGPATVIGQFLRRQLVEDAELFQAAKEKEIKLVVVQAVRHEISVRKIQFDLQFESGSPVITKEDGWAANLIEYATATFGVSQHLKKEISAEEDRIAGIGAEVGGNLSFCNEVANLLLDGIGGNHLADDMSGLEPAKSLVDSLLTVLEKIARNEELLSEFQALKFFTPAHSATDNPTKESFIQALPSSITAYLRHLSSRLSSLLESSCESFIDQFILRRSLLALDGDLSTIIDRANSSVPDIAAETGLSSSGLHGLAADKAALDRALGFRLNSHLPDTDLILIGSAREKLREQISATLSLYSSFPGDEAILIPTLRQFKIKLGHLRDEVAAFNEIFTFYSSSEHTKAPASGADWARTRMWQSSLMGYGT